LKHCCCPVTGLPMWCERLSHAGAMTPCKAYWLQPEMGSKRQCFGPLIE